MKRALYSLIYGCMGTWLATFNFVYGHGLGVILGTGIIAFAVVLAMLPEDETEPLTDDCSIERKP